MKTLTLLRHASAAPPSVTGTDFGRALTARGRADAVRIGEEIMRRGLGFDRQLSSPATRAVETAGLAGLQPDLEPAIYEASTSQLLALVQASGGAAETVVMVGHNPGLERLASWLTGGNVALTTGSLVSIALPVRRWHEVAAGAGKLALLIRPEELG